MDKLDLDIVHALPEAAFHTPDKTSALWQDKTAFSYPSFLRYSCKLRQNMVERS